MRAPWRKALAGLALACCGAAFALEPPKLDARVTDLTGTLDATQLAALESRSAALEREKGSQLVMLIVPSTQPETIEAFALAVFERNEIGRKDVDDGVLLLVAKDDRRARIEVGYGLEGAVPDAVANRVIAEYLAPRFREGRFYAGIDEASAALAQLVRGESLPAPLATPRPTGGGELDNPMGAIWLGVFIGLFVGSALQRVPRIPRAALVGVLAFIGLSFPFSWLMSLLGSATAAFVSTRRLNVGGGGGFGTGGLGRGGWGGGGGGWSGGGGGWSGGGGRSGGGGASGSW